MSAYVTPREEWLEARRGRRSRRSVAGPSPVPRQASHKAAPTRKKTKSYTSGEKKEKEKREE